MFQKKVMKYSEIPDGFPGQLAEANINTTVGCISIVDNQNSASPGTFLIGEIDNTSKRYKYAKVAKGNIANKSVLGVVLLNSQKNADVMRSDKVIDGSQIMYLKKGAVYITATADAQAGFFVHLKEQDGSLAFNKDRSLASHIYTGFRVSQGGKQNELIMIESV